MIEIMFGIILAPIALVAGVFTIALGLGFFKGLFKHFTKRWIFFDLKPSILVWMLGFR